MPRATLPTRPSSAPATRPSTSGRTHLVARQPPAGDDYTDSPRLAGRGRRPNREAEDKYFPHRRTRSPEQQREEAMALKRQINELSQELVQAHAATARLEQQNALQARQIETLLRDSDRGGAAVAGIQRHYERSLIVKRLRERIDDLLASVRERDDIISRLRRSHRNSVVLELETAKEEYFAELSRLNRALDRARAEPRDPLDAVCTPRVSSASRIDHSQPIHQPSSPPPKKQREAKKKARRLRSHMKKKVRPSPEPVKSVTEELLIIEDNDSQDSGNGAAAQHDALRLLYREAREIAINSVTSGFGASKAGGCPLPKEERVVYCRDNDTLPAVWDTHNSAPESADNTLAYSNDTTLHVSPHSNSTDQSGHRPGDAVDVGRSDSDGSKSPQSPGTLSLASRRAQYNSQTDLDLVAADMELSCFHKWMATDDAGTRRLCTPTEIHQPHSTPSGIQLDTATHASTGRGCAIRIQGQCPKANKVTSLCDESRRQPEDTHEGERGEKASARPGRVCRDRGERRPAKDRLQSVRDARQRALETPQEENQALNEASERIGRACSKYLTCRSAKQDLRTLREVQQLQAAEALEDARSLSQASVRIGRAYRDRILCREAKEQLHTMREARQRQLDDMQQINAQSLSQASARIGRAYRDRVACRSAKQLLDSEREARQSQLEAQQEDAQTRCQASARIARAYRNSVECRPAMEQLRLLRAEKQRWLEEERDFTQSCAQASARIGRAYRDSVKRRSTKEHIAQLSQERRRQQLNQKAHDDESEEKLQPESLTNLTLDPVVNNAAHPEPLSYWDSGRMRMHDTDGTRPPSRVGNDRRSDKEAEEPASAAAQASTPTEGASVGDAHTSQLARGEEAGEANDHRDDAYISDTEYEDDFADD